MTIITLISDWKKNDYYSGAIKGAILSNCQNVTIVDITHEIPSYTISQAAFVLRNCFHNYPEKTIHIICIKSETLTETPYLLAKAHNQYFISADNGIFSLIFPDDDAEIYSILPQKESTSFPELDVFTKVAIHLANEKDIKEITKPADSFYKQVPLRATIDDSVINGSVIYIDSYQNIITNITLDLFNRVGKGINFEIYVQSNHYKIKKINSNYQETTQGELLAIFNSIKLLEIAINNGNIAELLNLNIGTSIRIKFK